MAINNPGQTTVFHLQVVARLISLGLGKDPYLPGRSEEGFPPDQRGRSTGVQQLFM
jgi:hypothetical protein